MSSQVCGAPCAKVARSQAISSKQNMKLAASRPTTHAKMAQNLSARFSISVSGAKFASVSVKKISTSTRAHRSVVAIGEGDGNVIHVDSTESWEEALALSKDKLLVLDISTKTCGPCKLVYPTFVKLSEDHKDVVFVKIMGDANPQTRGIMQQWRVRSAPQFHFWKNMKKVNQVNGSNHNNLTVKLQEVKSVCAVSSMLEQFLVMETPKVPSLCTTR